MSPRKVLYKTGQLVRHNRYRYRGVIVAVDPECKAPEDWYLSNKSQPDREQPWYHVLVAGTDQITYPAQSSLLPDESCDPVEHPLVPHFFDAFDNGHYDRNGRAWPDTWK